MRRRGPLLVALAATGSMLAVTTPPAVGVPAATACTITQTRSLEGTVKTSIRFVNATAGAVTVNWLDYDGKRVPYQTLQPGASYVQPTWQTHPWVAIDAAGRCVGYVVAPTAQYVIGGTSKKPTFTGVVCTIGVAAPTSTCTAQVADTSPQRSNPPTGIVTFRAARGSVGSQCTLAGTPGSPGISSCTVSYDPPPNLVTGTPPPVTARYPGDPTFEPSSGGTSYAPTSVVVPSTVTATVGGIPTTLLNRNPFPVSAVEVLTVPGRTTSARSATRAAAPVIGRTTVRLRPLTAVATKVRLNAKGRALLAKQGSLKAVLTVTTSAKGKPTKVTTKRITIKAG